MPLLNLAQGRDFIRRTIQITPPIDSGTGAVGAAPSAFPDPSNPTLNQMVWSLLESINQKAGFQSTTSISIPVTVGQTANGPYAIPLSGIMPQSANLINDVQRVSWINSAGYSVPLEAWSFNDLDRTNYQYDNMAPSTPQYYYVKSYTLYLVPAPASPGAVGMYAGLGILTPLADSDYIQNLPETYQNIVWKGAACEWLKTKAQDSQSQALLSVLLPDYKDGLMEIQAWMTGQNKKQVHSFGVRSYRYGAGLRSNKT